MKKKIQNRPGFPLRQYGVGDVQLFNRMYLRFNKALTRPRERAEAAEQALALYISQVFFFFFTFIYSQLETTHRVALSHLPQVVPEQEDSTWFALVRVLSFPMSLIDGYERFRRHFLDEDAAFARIN